MNKEKIIMATLELACENGLRSVSMSQIAEKAGIKKSSLYSHFSAKEEIITEMYNNTISNLNSIGFDVEVVEDFVEIEDGNLTHLELLPIELGFGEPRYRLGNPRVCKNCGIVERYAEERLFDKDGANGAKFSLANTGRTKKDERADRSAWILEARSCTAHGTHHATLHIKM